MSFFGGGLGTAAAIFGGSLLGANAASEAGQAQAEAAKYAADLQMKQYQQQVALSQPWRQAGQTALNALVPLSTNYTPFGMQQFQQDPGYAFRMSEGLKALDRSASARGGLLSGGTLKAAQQYGQGLASEEYQNAFNRYQAERQAQLGPLQSLAGIGQTATQNLGALGQQAAYGAAQDITSAGAARAAGNVGMANALNQGLSTYLNYSQGQNMLNALGGSRGLSPYW